MSKLMWKAVIHRAVLFGAGWLVLTQAEPGALLPGAAVVAFAVWLSLRLLPARHPLAVWRMASHFPRFVAGSVSGGIDVARRAFSPSLPLKPGWVEMPNDLPDGARVVLGGELSLMPGTLAAGTNQGRLLVHLLDVDAGFEEAIRREEDNIAAMIGQPEADRA